MIKQVLQGRSLNVLLRLLVGGVFVYAAWDKILHPHQFAITVRAYKIIPMEYSNLFAVAVPWAEILAGAMLIAGVLTRKAAATIMILLVMFILAMSTVLVRGMVIDCGCFGSEGGSTIGPLLLVRNVLMVLATFVIIRYNDGFLSLFPGRAATS